MLATSRPVGAAAAADADAPAAVEIHITPLQTTDFFCILCYTRIIEWVTFYFTYT